jgi:putative ABC transport system permease protein
MWSGNFKSAISNLRQYKGRSFLTMLGIIIGISSVVTVVSLGEGLKNQVVGQINQLGNDVITIRPGRLTGEEAGQNSISILALLSASTLKNEDAQKISELEGVGEVAPINFVTNSAAADERRLDNVFVVGTSPDMPKLLNQEVEYGSFFSDSNQTNSVVIGAKVAEQLFRRLNPVGSTIRISGQDFIVQGVLEQSDGGLLSVAQTDFNMAVFMSMGSANAITGGRENILQILARDTSGDLDAAVADIEKVVTDNHGGQTDFSVLTQEQLLDIASDVVDSITGFISAIAAVSLLVGGIGIMDIMLVSVSERTREIGVRKTVGATNRQILSQFLTEGLVLSLTGGILGILLALAINGFLRLYTSFEPIISIPVLAIAAGVSIAIGIIFSSAPAIKASRKPPIDALRGE